MQSVENRRRFNVLVVSPTPTHAPIRGNRKKILGLANRLQEAGGKIHFVYFPREWGMKLDEAELRAMKAHWDEVFIVPPSKQVVSSTTKEHYDIDDWWDDNIGRTCNWLSWGIFFDIVIVNYAFLSKCFEYLNKNFLRVLDTHDVFSNRKEMLIANNLPVDFFYTTESQERIALERASLILAIKPSEAAHFRSLAATPVLDLGHFDGTTTPGEPGPRLAGPVTFGYLGSENPVNRENLRRFLAAFAPILEANPESVRMRIVGLISDYALSLPQARLANVEVVGRIDDAARFYEELCDVVVSPFDFGTGLKIKTVEAVSFGKPVIGTLHAFEGIATSEPMHLFPSVRDMVEGCRAVLASREPVIKALADASESIRRTLRDQLEHAVSCMVRAAGSRRLVLVTDPGFWREETALQRRTAVLIRQLSGHVHVHIVCAAPSQDGWRERLTEWQWGNSFHLNEAGADPDTFVAQTVRFLDPAVCIIQTPTRVVRDVACAELYLDFTGLSAPGWLAALAESDMGFRTAPLLLHSSVAAADVARSIPGLATAEAAAMPMVDFDIYVRVGASLAVVCDDPILWAPTILRTAKQLLCFAHWDGRIQVYQTDPAAEMQAIDGIPCRLLDSADALPPVTHTIRACVHLGRDDPLATDLKTGLLNQGVSILRYSGAVVAAEPYEVGCCSVTELMQHLAMIFASDQLAQRYASLSNAYARFALALPGLTNWCRQLGLRAARSVDCCLRAEAT